jgi:putative transposase
MATLQFHFSKNIVELAPKKYQAGLQFELNAHFQAKNLKEAIQKRDDILQSYGDEAERAMKCLEDGFEDAMTVLLLPIGMRPILPYIQPY